MGKSRRKHNWKARLQPDVELSHDQNIEVSDIVVHQGSHIYWKTWKNASIPAKPGKIMEFCKK